LPCFLHYSLAMGYNAGRLGEDSGLTLMRRTIWLTVVAAALWGQKISTGPEVGSTLPDFTAQDQAGRTQTLKSIMGTKGAMVVFYRSADW
jgi:hypothetical protein